MVRRYDRLQDEKKEKQHAEQGTDRVEALAICDLEENLQADEDCKMKLRSDDELSDAEFANTLQSMLVAQELPQLEDKPAIHRLGHPLAVSKSASSLRVAKSGMLPLSIMSRKAI